MSCLIIGKTVNAGEIPVTLNVAVPKHFPPQYQLNTAGQPVGFAVDVLDEIARQAKFKVNYQVKANWSDTFDALNKGEVDLIPNIGVSEKRKEFFAHTDPVETCAISIFVRTSSVDINSVNNLSNKKVASVKGNIAVNELKKNPGIAVTEYSDINDALFALLSGEVDAFVYPEPWVWNLARKLKVDERIKIAAAPISEVKHAMAVQIGNTELLATLNEHLKSFVHSQEYKNLYIKWYGKKETYWYEKRVLLVVFIVIACVLLLFFIWHYSLVIKLNRLLTNERELRDKEQEKLLKRENHYRVLLESTSAIPWELDLETWQFIYVGPQIEKVTGYSQEEWYTTNFWANNIHPADKDYAVNFCTDATSRAEDHEFEYRFVKKNGEVIWIRDVVQVIVENEVPIRLRGFMFDITKKVIKEEHHSYLEKRLAEAQNIAHVGFWDLDLLANDLRWSEETYRIFEVNAQMVKPSYETFLELLHPDDKLFVQKAYEDSLTEGNSQYDIEHRLLMSDGRVKFVHERCETNFDDEGKPVRSFGTVQDITEKYRTDQAIKTIAASVSSEMGDEFYRQMVTSMAEMFEADYAFIGLLDKNNSSLINTYMVYAHGKIVPNMSYSLDDTPCAYVVGKEACSYPDKVQELFPNDKLLSDMGANSYVGIPVNSSSNDPIGLVVVLDSKPMKNTTQMQEVLKIFAARIEAELEKKRADETIKRLSLAIEQNPSMTIITDHDGKIEYVNPAFTEITGYTYDEVIGQNPSMLKSDLMPKSFYKELWEIVSSGETWTGTIYNKKKNGELYWDEAIISPVKNAQGEITHFLSIQSDITEKKQTEQQLRRSQKMDALGKLTGGIAHDYNNMLNVIHGYTELLEMIVDPGEEKIHTYLKEIYKASERGSDLTRKLLSFSRQEYTEAEEVDINQVLNDDFNMLSKTLTARIQLEYELNENIWPIFIDKGDLEDAILNLSINAMHAMPDGGMLKITTYNRELSGSDASIMNVEPGEYVQLSINDTGVGMDQDVLNQIFDPFFSTKGEMGTGLGLTQVYGFVNRAHGTITVDSSLNNGSYFSLYFPRYVSATEVTELHDDKIKIDSGTESILVVDDEPALRNLAKVILEKNGYQVFIASGGNEALQILEKTQIDLVLSDVIMPIMDGYELAEKVREKYPAVKIQLVSGFSDDRNRTDEDNALFEKILHKPFNTNSLLGAIRKCLDE